MARKHVLDAHALIWYQEGNARLGSNALTIMSDPASEMIISVIALAEAAYAVEKGRTKIPSVADLLNDVISDQRIEVYPVTLEILQQSQSALAVPEMHDRLIVATTQHLQSLGQQAVLLTKDLDIVNAALVPIIW